MPKKVRTDDQRLSFIASLLDWDGHPHFMIKLVDPRSFDEPVADSDLDELRSMIDSLMDNPEWQNECGSIPFNAEVWNS